MTKDDDEEAQLPVIDADADAGGVSSAFREIWSDAPESEIYKFLSVRVAPRISTHLAAVLELQEADRDDCVSQAFERFRPAIENRASVSNPYAYVFTIAVNEARQLLRARRAEAIDDDFDVDRVADLDVDAFQLVDAGEAGEPDGPLALDLIEDAVPELEVEGFWAVEVVRDAVAGLPIGSRRILELLMFKDLAFDPEKPADFAYASTDAPVDLGMKEGAFRTAKHRAYARLREAIPRTIVAMGLQPPERAEAAIFPNGRWREAEE
ncbi:sigma-70 family RNA polymerase sigma factor [Sphingomonas sp. LY54]|uniref:RNA polymerase sigma factor n=1 Tax=Sphingomonas sp. LY54 TaxID=3095343 RepID=UPI002D765A22|nr:sigma-70 family RNA polymerase sigma factor [Sphingomonas sp. LY54]WRP29785.1 sigma-70 family RNA polymerase sigma factor [Sphingomonas sp. LY54]